VELAPDPAILLELIRARMPFGKYEGWRLTALPEAYLLYFRRQGWPSGKLGQQMALALEIKTHGLEPLIRELAAREGQ